ncbi:Dse1 protein [Martiniozyma asiatica (nom. inval.)]|nr:Dse1 protein [Martiniozyma asiatica]
MKNSLKLKSNYWKINQTDADDCILPSNVAMAQNNGTLAVGTNVSSENLKIYNLANSSLTHLTSISLPDIHSLEFLHTTTEPPHDFKFLLTGHSSGFAHLTTIPISDDSPFENAEIIKRFNHAKHIKNSDLINFNKNWMLNTDKPSTTINSLALSPSSWSTPLNTLNSIYNNHVFLWDTTRSRKPKAIIAINGASIIEASSENCIAGVAGDFGINLIDWRSKTVVKEMGNQSKIWLSNTKFATTPSMGKVNDKFTFVSKRSSLSPRSATFDFSSPNSPTISRSTTNNSINRLYGSTALKFSDNCNYLSSATISPSGHIVQIWDIRKEEPLAILEGFKDQASQMKWQKNLLWVADNDGCVSKWDLSSVIGGEKSCVTANSIKSTSLQDNESFEFNNSTKKFNLRGTLSINTLRWDEKQNEDNSIGVSYKVSNGSIVGMEMLENKGILCLDGNYLSSHIDKSQPPTIDDNIISTPPKLGSIGDIYEDMLFSSNSSSKTATSVISNLDTPKDYKTLQAEIDEMLNNLGGVMVNDQMYL